MIDLETLLSRLADRAAELDAAERWPQEQLDWLAEAGVVGWVIPKVHGGSEVAAPELIRGYQRLAASCLTTTFILTQRNGACQRIAASENEELKASLLPDLARGAAFATVGVSHLTTSRQHIAQPAVRVLREADRLRVDGQVPWVTGAAHARTIVTGGTCSDGRQVLFALPTDAPGVTVLPHAQLMALSASRTASVELRNVELPLRQLLAGPEEQVMTRGGGGAGSLTTSALALGLSARAAALLSAQAQLREELQDVAEGFETALGKLREDIDRAAALAGPPPELSAAAIRQRANSLAARITQAALAVSKGAGFVRGHPAERSVREAMFFLVWSCPQPVVQGVLQEFICRDAGDPPAFASD